MVRLTLILLLSMFLAAPLSGGAAVWTDAMDRQVELPATPQRIVSLVPSVTEILFALGAGDRLVGATRYGTYPPAARALPRVGDYGDPNLEVVALLNPDLVLLAADAASPALLARIEALGIAAYVVYPKDIAETLATIRRLGRILARPEAGARVAAELESKLAAVRRTAAGRPRPSVLFCVMTEPLVVAGPGTLIDDLIRVAGGRNVVPAGAMRYPTWNLESLLAADPDLIVASVHPGQAEPAELAAAWPELTAARHRRIVTIEPDWVSRPGPRLALGAEALQKIFQDSVAAAGDKGSP